ncbi:YraN family protein [Acinetobacter sp. 194]|uniref:YraN family protein n=1 Tax=Acinetobacter shaoyimingii TaxID=2715164 RepID=UPI00140E5513|nr:YraN family protein [Acinetobacter shaoyimingii]NHB57827.1 YraN family protein [Acinetobacter shaoyimingii]
MARSKHLGQWAEAEAVNLIKDAGYTMIQQNYHSRFGEIDVIAVHDEKQELIFVEVKARSATQWGHAYEVVTASKQIKIYKTALKFIEQHPQFHHHYYRFDVICFDFYKEIAKNLHQDISNLAYDQQWIENAFTLNADLINL